MGQDGHLSLPGGSVRNVKAMEVELYRGDVGDIHRSVESSSLHGEAPRASTDLQNP